MSLPGEEPRGADEAGADRAAAAVASESRTGAGAAVTGGAASGPPPSPRPDRRSLLASRFLRRYFPAIAATVQVVLDGATVFASCALAYFAWCRVQPLPQVVGLRDYAPLFIGIVLVQIPLFASCRLYRQQKTILNIAEFQGILRATVFGAMITGLLHFTLEESVLRPRVEGAPSGLYSLLSDLHHAIAIVPSNTWSRYVIVLSFAIMLLLVSVERWVCFKALQRLHLKGVGTTNILLVGAGRLGRMVQRTLFLSPRLGFNLAGFLDDDPELRGAEVDGAQVLGAIGDLADVVATRKVGLVLVASSRIPQERRAELAETCRAMAVDVAFVPRLWVSDDLPLLRVGSFDRMPLLTFGIVRPGPLYVVGKRVFDLLVAALAIALLSPLLILLLLLIRLESPGPAIFRQQRVGKDGRRFDMLKFRSMRVDGPRYARSPTSGRDPRLTRLGRFLRRTSLDELPQLFCVLRGDMSIVGPRPEMPFIVDAYDAHTRQRLLAKPGITGLWQISWARDAEIHENLDYDLYYVEHPSLTMDVVIVALTAFSVVRGIGAH